MGKAQHGQASSHPRKVIPDTPGLTRQAQGPEKGRDLSEVPQQTGK